MNSQTCFLTMIGKQSKCLKAECAAWDNDHNQCWLIAALQSTMQQLLLNSKMMDLYKELQKKIGEDDE
jgi:hypothetical protein